MIEVIPCYRQADSVCTPITMPTKTRRPKIPLTRETLRDGKIVLFVRSDYKKPVWQCRLKFRGLPQETYSTGETEFYEARKFADILYEKRLGQIHAGIDIKSKFVIVALDEFIEHVKGTEPNTPSRKSKLSNVSRWRPFFTPKERIKEVTTDTLVRLNGWLSQQSSKGTLASETLKRIQTYQRGFLNWCRDKGYLTSLPALPKLRVKKGRRCHIDELDYQRLYATFKRFQDVKHARIKRARMMLVNYVLVLANTGIRVGEARGLRWRDIGLIHESGGADTKHHLCLHVNGKTEERDVVARDISVKGYLERIYELRQNELGHAPSVDDFVFCDTKGKPIRSFRKSFDSLLDMAGIRTNGYGERRTIYSLRHTYATFRLQSGVDTMKLAMNMGTSASMIERYYGHTTNIGEAAELTKVGSVKRKRVIGVRALRAN